MSVPTVEYLTSTTPARRRSTPPWWACPRTPPTPRSTTRPTSFSVRGSVAYRDGYLTQVPGNDGNTVQGTNSTLNVDMQASVNLRENLKLSFEGVNLTDEFNDQYVGDSNRLNVNTHSGRTFFVGLRYNF
jgi:iron complex outermembrane receptor protein